MFKPDTRENFDEIKKLFPDVVLMFREYNHFAAYYDDAGILSLVLGLTVCDDRVAFPEGQLGGHCEHLKRAGYKTCLVHTGTP